MPGYIILQKVIRRDDLSSNPTVLYVFGGNVRGQGMRGQALYGQHMPNGVGIPTKWEPNANPGSYFSDEQFDEVIPLIEPHFNRLKAHLHSGGVVVWPTDGIGIGYAKLDRLAPEIYKYILRSNELLWRIVRG